MMKKIIIWGLCLVQGFRGHPHPHPCSNQRDISTSLRTSKEASPTPSIGIGRPERSEPSKPRYITIQTDNMPRTSNESKQRNFLASLTNKLSRVRMVDAGHDNGKLRNNDGQENAGNHGSERANKTGEGKEVKQRTSRFLNMINVLRNFGRRVALGHKSLIRMAILNGRERAMSRRKALIEHKIMEFETPQKESESNNVMNEVDSSEEGKKIWGSEANEVSDSAMNRDNEGYIEQQVDGEDGAGIYFDDNELDMESPISVPASSSSRAVYPKIDPQSFGSFYRTFLAPKFCYFTQNCQSKGFNKLVRRTLIRYNDLSPRRGNLRKMSRAWAIFELTGDFKKVKKENEIEEKEEKRNIKNKIHLVGRQYTSNLLIFLERWQAALSRSSLDVLWPKAVTEIIRSISNTNALEKKKNDDKENQMNNPSLTYD